MILVDSSLNSEHVSLMTPIYIEKMYFGTETSGLIARVVLISGGLYCGTLLYFQSTFFITLHCITDG